MDNTMENKMENKVESQGHLDYNVGDYFDLLYLLPAPNILLLMENILHQQQRGLNK